MIDYFQNLISSIDPLSAYFLLFVSAFFENILPPIPGDTVVVFGAYLVSIGQLGFWGVYVSTTLGSLAGFISMYYVGLKYGRPFVYKKSRARIFKPEQIKRVEVWFSRWGYGVIFANRFLSGTRSVISIFAGLFHLNWLKVLFLALISAAIWNALLIGAGILLGHNWSLISEIISQYNKVFLAILIMLIVIFTIQKFRNRKKTGNKID